MIQTGLRIYFAELEARKFGKTDSLVARYSRPDC